MNYDCTIEDIHTGRRRKRTTTVRVEPVLQIQHPVGKVYRCPRLPGVMSQ